MVCKKHRSSYSAVNKGVPSVLAICWVGGLIAGAGCYCTASPEQISLVCRVVFSPATIVGLLNVVMIPFLLSVFAMTWFSPWFLVGIGFAKAFLFSFVSLVFLANYSGGGWLLRLLLLFEDCLTLPFLYWYWIRTAGGSLRDHLVETGTVCGVLLLVAFFDLRFVSPFVCLIDSMKG